MKQPPYFFDAPQEVHPERLWVLKHIGDPAGRVILDIGCGAHKTLPEAIGVDVRPVTDTLASMDDIPLISFSADVIISRHSLEHALDTVQVLSEWRRLLKPGGMVLIILPDHAAINTLDVFYSAGQHLHAFTRESFQHLINALNIGLRLESIETVVEDWSFGAVLR